MRLLPTAHQEGRQILRVLVGGSYVHGPAPGQDPEQSATELGLGERHERQGSVGRAL